MKTLNQKLFLPLILTLLVSGCMPDSLTKFKKEPPKKTTESAVNTDLPPDITDETGNVIDPDTIDFPTKFFYISEGAVPVRPLTVGTIANITPSFDGTLGVEGRSNLIFVRCEILQTGPVITRTLPPGMSLEASTCNIKGTPISVYSDTTPGNVGNPITYTIRLFYKGETYQGPGTESTLDTSIKLASYVAPTSLYMTQNDKLLLKLNLGTGGAFANIKRNTDPLVAYDRAGVMTSINGVSAIVKFVDTSASLVGASRVTPIVVSSTVPFSVNGFISTAGNAKVGKILSINSTTSTLFVESLVSNAYFAAGDLIDNAQSFVASNASVVSVTTDYVMRKAFPQIDNDSQYFSNKFNIVTVSQTYEVGTAIPTIAPIASASIATANGLTYSITPALPDGLSFDTATGEISGTFSDILNPTDFTITATNLVGSTTYVLNLAAIKTPRDLSYTTRQLVNVDSNTLFKLGEQIFQPITPPLTESIRGRILKKVSTDYLSIDTVNGSFNPGVSLDSGSAYFSEKSFVIPDSTTINYDLAITVASTASFSSGEYISTTAGAKGRVVFVDTANNTLYVQFLTPNTSSIVTFTEGSNIDDAETYAVAETTISEVESNNAVLTVTVPGAFTVGSDLTSDASDLSGYLYNKVGSNLYVSDISRAGSLFFRIGDDLDNQEYFDTIESSVTGVSHHNFIIIERGINTTIFGNLSQGNSVAYSISPNLPAGLTLNPSTGAISGTPTVRVPTKRYIITATNLVGSSSYAFDMEVRDFFTYADTSGASSFHAHKIGENQTFRSCRINVTDILNASNSAALDVGCYLEAEEQDLYYTKLKITASIGAGACEFVQLAPFSFWQYSPRESTAAQNVNIISGCSTGDAAVPPFSGYGTTAPTREAQCVGTYTDDGGPNCDPGSYTVTTHTFTQSNALDPLTCAKTAESTTTVTCNGKKANCLSGPVVSSGFLTTNEINSGFRSIFVPSNSGAKQTWTFRSPFDNLDVSNMRNSNNFTNNSCNATRSNANTWKAHVTGVAATTSPFGTENPFYELNCLDGAKDVKARIRIVVRDWNRAFKIDDNVDRPFPHLAPTAMNVPSKMDDIALDPIFGNNPNNYDDWDNTTGDYSACGTVNVHYPYPEDGL